MGSFNALTICGNLGKKPELRFTTNQTPVASFSIAQTQKTGDVEQTFWIDVEMWGKPAETFEKHHEKGDFVYVTGGLKYEEWQDKNTGAKRTKLKMKAWQFQFMPRKSQDGQQPAQAASGSYSQGNDAGQNPVDDDLPF